MPTVEQKAGYDAHSTPGNAAGRGSYVKPSIDLVTIGEDCDWIMAEGHHPLVEFAIRAYDYGRIELDLWDTDALAEAVIASRHAYARPASAADYADIEDEEEREHALENALDEDWIFWTDQPTDRPVTVTGRLN